MRKIAFLLVLLVGFGVINAQEKSARDFKIEGADAYKAKDYSTALSAFEQAIKLYETDNDADTSLYFNAGYCAYKTKDFEKANAYMNTSIKLNYKVCKAKLLMTSILKKQKKTSEMLVMAEEGAKNCPKNRAKFNKVIAGYHKKVALKAYNKASKKLTKVNALAKSNPNKFKSEMIKVQKMFNTALVLLEKAKSYKAEQAIIDAITQSKKIIATKY
jgi:tetratricopeptide (TPR) repeat protein